MTTQSQEDSLFSAKVNDSRTHLTVGAPGDSVLFRLPDMFRDGCNKLINDSLQQLSVYQYGPELGTTQYRQELAAFLSRRYGEEVSWKELLLTTGATNGLSLVSSCLVKHQGVVFVENPTYFIALQVIKKDLGLNVVPIEMTEDGIDIDDLKTRIEEFSKTCDTELGADGRFWAMVYTIPTFHNPTGITMSRNRAEKLIKLTKESNVLVLCDDVYNLLAFNDQNYSRMKSINPSADNIISNGTFSKILAPGVRLGWLEAPMRIVSQLQQSGILLSGGSQNHWMSGVATSMIQLGHMDAHLDHCCQTYKQRMDAAVDILSSKLPSSWSVKHPGGGYFLWIVTNLENVETFTITLEKKKDILVMPGYLASPNHQLNIPKKNCFRNCFRICIAFYDLEGIKKSCSDLCDIANEICS